MRNILTIAGRELRSYFVSPIAYVVMTGFLLLGGWFFFNLLARFNYLVSMYSSFQGGREAMQRLNLNEFVIAPLLHNLSVVLVILVPMITMRSFAEEKRAGTYELLLTSPVATWEIVLGKFFGAVAFIFVMVGLTGVYGLILSAYGNPEFGIMAAGYLGLFLLSVTFVTIGLFASSLTENQIIAAVAGLVMLLLLYVISWPADTAGETMGGILRYISVTEHFGDMVKGVVDTKSLVYFASMIIGWIFLTERSVESIRWR
ncbi:MAG TPA: ABC transporter permease subunit [Candidatus Bathyarchaeia archaeon]|nr:ABC transporter permease subunit [Candidatus Bathyarchaeia archaeon]